MTRHEGSGEVRVTEIGAERIEEIRELCLELFASIRAAEGDGVPGVQMRPRDQIWEHRRASYLEWLAQADTFALLAEDAATGQSIGYAVVDFGDELDPWDTHGRYAEIESLGVTADRRGEGVGGALMEEIYRRLRALGVQTVLVGAVAGNEGAVRFYERHGLMRWAVQSLGRVPPGPEQAP